MQRSRRDFVKVLLGASAAAMLPARMARAAAREGLVPVRHSTFVMGQMATITAYGAPAQELREAITAAFDALRRVDVLMSVFSQSSDVGRINLAAGRDEVGVDPWTGDLLRSSIAFSQRTGGAFDPTVEPLMRAWGFRDSRATMPTERELEGARDALGVGHLHVSTVQQTCPVALDRESSKIDLGGIAVGFAIDRAVAVMRARGVQCALIDVSGDLYAIGAPPDATGWKVGIVDPRNPERIITECTIRDQALSTSGNYATVVMYNAIKYGHIMNPRDGYPAHEIASATVIAPTALAADALSTGVFVNPAISVPEGSIVLVKNSGDVVRVG